MDMDPSILSIIFILHNNTIQAQPYTCILLIRRLELSLGDCFLIASKRSPSVFMWLCMEGFELLGSLNKWKGQSWLLLLIADQKGKKHKYFGSFENILSALSGKWCVQLDP